MKVRYLLLMVGLLPFVSSCKQETVPSTHCANASALVKQVSQARGQVYYDPTQSSYFIRVPNSMDSYDIGYTCNLATEYQKNGLQVKFSGSYYDYDRTVSGIAGNRYYYLSLDSVSLN